MKYLEREVRKTGADTPLAYYHAHWTRQGSPLLDLLGAVIDHVEAFSSGGVSDIENLATACNKCNGRKSAAPLAKWGESDRWISRLRANTGNPKTGMAFQRCS
jgi:5-methylcytosine-specific restriction endonuclease McrA